MLSFSDCFCFRVSLQKHEIWKDKLDTATDFPIDNQLQPDLPKWFPLAWSRFSILSSHTLFFFAPPEGSIPTVSLCNSFFFWHITLLDPPQRPPIIHFWYHCLVVESEEGCTLGSGSQDWHWDVNSFILETPSLQPCLDGGWLLFQYWETVQ